MTDAVDPRIAYVRAMLAFRRSCPPVVAKDSTVRVAYRGGGGHSYVHASLPQILTTITPALSEAGLLVTWARVDQELERPIRRGPDGEDEYPLPLVSVSCLVSHVDGHVEATTMTGPMDDSGSKNAIQGLESTVTYLCRYTLMAALGLASTDDDGRAGTVGWQSERVDRPTRTPPDISPTVSEHIDAGNWAQAYKCARTMADSRAVSMALAATPGIPDAQKDSLRDLRDETKARLAGGQ